jgi:hypothetical protein
MLRQMRQLGDLAEQGRRKKTLRWCEVFENFRWSDVSAERGMSREQTVCEGQPLGACIALGRDRPVNHEDGPCAGPDANARIDRYQ